jgi:ribosomal protein L37E
MNKITHTTCGRCLGEGSIRAFSHVVSGRCFACGGSGSLRVSSRRPAPKSAPHEGRSAIDELRSLYLAGRSRTGAERAYWCESIAEPLDANYGPHSILSGARYLVSILDAGEADKVRAAFLGLGVNL